MNFKIILSIFILFFSFLKADVFDKKIETPEIIFKNTYKKTIFEKDRIYSDITLKSKDFEVINFTVSFPKDLSKAKRILILIDGLKTSKDVLNYFKPLDDYILIGFEFDKTLNYLNSKKSIFHIFSLRKAVLDTPFQVVSLIKWLKTQTWFKNDPIIMGISFGAIFVPATYHVAKLNNIDLGPCILAFGGANIYEIFYANLNNYFLFRKQIAKIAALIFNPIDPKYHMKYIKPPLLIINGTDDTFIPKKSAKLLQELANDPKTIINLETKHIMPDNKSLIEKVYNISNEWLKKI
ncbi:MAG: hypothetical protein K1060chlam5_01186 [Candidatus Anoxychlamydiales bacterium]|nr:hypothetical protein [Candidatus Anoxychlamydiales bacterium]